MSEMPDFEPPVPPAGGYPQPKKPRRKPAKRKAAKVVVRVVPKRIVKKRKVAKRRGRPVGALNKPKVTDLVRVPYTTNFVTKETYAAIQHMLTLDPAVRSLALSIIQGLAK